MKLLALKLLGSLVHVIVCLADLDHCARWQMDPWGLWCSDFKPRSGCPKAFEPAGEHVVYGYAIVCSRGCEVDP